MSGKTGRRAEILGRGEMRTSGIKDALPADMSVFKGAAQIIGFAGECRGIVLLLQKCNKLSFTSQHLLRGSGDF